MHSPKWFFILLIGMLLYPFSAQGGQLLMPTSGSILPLVLDGAQVPELVGAKVTGVTALVCENDRLVPIPSQVDELNDEGRVVSRFADRSIAPDSTPGVMDANDQLVVMLRDLRGACPQSTIERAVGRIIGIEVKESQVLKTALLYLLLSDRAIPTNESYVTYEPAAHRVTTRLYTIETAPDNPLDFTHVSFVPLEGRSHTNILDKYKMRIKVRALKDLITLTYGEDDLTIRLEGVRTGPVRTVREVAMRIDVVPGYSLDANGTMVFYDGLLRVDARIKAPVAAKLFVSSMDVKVILDFFDLRGTRLSTSSMSDGLLVNGETAPQEQSIVFGKEPWFMLSGLGLNSFLSLELEDDLKLTRAAVFIDDPLYDDGPEQMRGALPAVGYELLGWEGLEARWYTIGAYVAVLPGFPERGGTGFFRALHAPVTLSVTSTGETH